MTINLLKKLISRRNNCAFTIILGTFFYAPIVSAEEGKIQLIQKNQEINHLQIDSLPVRNQTNSTASFNHQASDLLINSSVNPNESSTFMIAPLSAIEIPQKLAQSSDASFSQPDITEQSPQLQEKKPSNLTANFSIQASDLLINSSEIPNNPSPSIIDPVSEIEISPKVAQSAENTSENNNNWQFKFQIPGNGITPITTYGSATVRGRTVDYNLNLGEVLDVLEFIASGRVEAWKGNLGFIVSGYYVSLGGSGIAESTRLPNATLKSELEFQQGIYDFALSYRFGKQPQYNSTEEPSNQSFPLVYFEPMIGTRLNDINLSIDAELRSGVGITRQGKVERGRTWFEPLIGGKLGVQISNPVTLWAKGDASGFGLAGETDMSWNLSFGADWRVSRLTSLQFGYYFYHIEYGNGSGNDAFGFEQSQNGPFLSATFHF